MVICVLCMYGCLGLFGNMFDFNHVSQIITNKLKMRLVQILYAPHSPRHVCDFAYIRTQTTNVLTPIQRNDSLSVAACLSLPHDNLPRTFDRSDHRVKVHVDVEVEVEAEGQQAEMLEMCITSL